ncbi:SGNH/GDSL hydrolase family protein [Nocardioides sp.]|uniref:SGNH/GDSL hydrolase family protein n=1 Tax=Nocardioides sp. TaxID=35761 RepID=UPI0031FEA250|nr:Lipase 2 precursor [Nocardioides sp.]
MTISSRAIGAAAAAALLVPLAGCASGAPESGPIPAPKPTSSSSAAGSTEPTPTAPHSQGVDPGAYPTYVALGDSFTAAPLASKTDPGDGCLRSRHNYPALIAAAMAGTKLDDRSCAGADTTSLIGVQNTPQGVVPAQFDALATDTSLVTVGIGGNDFGIYGTLIGTCPGLRASDPTGSPCQDQLTAGGTDQLLAEVAKLGPRLTSTIAGIRDRSPDAEIVVVGYPSAIAAGSTCPDLLPLADGDYAYAARINAALAETQKRAAKKADALYIDTFAASEGHDICSPDPWVNGQVTSADTALAFHPLLAEQRAVAQLVLRALPPHGVVGG